MKEKEDEPERVCPVFDISLFIKMAVGYREFFKTLQAGLTERIRRGPRTDLSVHYRERLDIYIDICDRIEREFSKL